MTYPQRGIKIQDSHPKAGQPCRPSSFLASHRVSWGIHETALQPTFSCCLTLPAFPLLVVDHFHLINFLYTVCLLQSTCNTILLGLHSFLVKYLFSKQSMNSKLSFSCLKKIPISFLLWMIIECPGIKLQDRVDNYFSSVLWSCDSTVFWQLMLLISLLLV